MPQNKCMKDPNGEGCLTHNCGPYDEQCSKPECPHCVTKNPTLKLQLTNSYLKAKDAGEVE